MLSVSGLSLDERSEKPKHPYSPDPTGASFAAVSGCQTHPLSLSADVQFGHLDLIIGGVIPNPGVVQPGESLP
jgi:hypothetical protein